ncbi:hypothetical protein [Nocardioides pelophilus]|uniref:hypothetical protein n=1 Tax=Nocardioides pelophilus TaxID=2172019 RepID=UPI0015FF6DEE|nr:hypothetical protein [Nocardioides pelophilus]
MDHAAQEEVLVAVLLAPRAAGELGSGRHGAHGDRFDPSVADEVANRVVDLLTTRVGVDPPGHGAERATGTGW